MSYLVDYQQNFIEFAMKHGVLAFGEYTLKSGRQSPYFFNMGELNTGDLLKEMSGFYAEAILASCVQFDVLFGPAYKGIPLATSTALALSDRGMNKPFCFNRKIVKPDGEGAQIVGAPLKGDVLIIDDVITAGTAVRESVDLITQMGAKPCAVIVAIDRQEKGQAHTSAIQEVSEEFGVPVISIINVDSIKCYLDQKGEKSKLSKVVGYQKAYGVV